MDKEFGRSGQAARLGVVFWRYDPAGGTLTWGADPALPLEGVLARIDPEDHGRFRDLLGGTSASATIRLLEPPEAAGPVLCRAAPCDGGFEGIAVPLPDADGAATLRHRAEAAEATAAYLRSALECLPDAVFLLDRDGRFVIANDRVRTLFPLMSDTMEPGRPFQEMLRIGLSRGAYPEAVGREEAWLAEALAFWTRPEAQVERTVRLSNGHWVMAVDRRLPEGGWIGLRIDITQLKQSEARLAAILDGSGHGTWEWDNLAEVCLTDPVMEPTVQHWLRSVGYTREDFGDLSQNGFFRTLVHPDDLVHLDAEFERHLKGETDHFDVELRQRHRDGHWVWGRMRGKVSERDIDGRPLRVAGVLVDITDIKSVQLELERSARLKVEFLERISHELRTPLNGVLGAVSLLSAMATDPAQVDLLAVAEDSGARLVTLIDRLVELTRLEDGRVDLDIAPLRLDDIAEDLRAGHAGTAADRRLGFDVFTDMTAGQPRLGDYRRLHDVLDRLVTHAIGRSVTGGIEVRIRGGAGDLVRIEVIDSGPPLDDETRARALEPLFHAEGNARGDDAGDGLGLWPTRRLVEAMGGMLELAEARTGGMVARIDLPLPPAAA